MRPSKLSTISRYGHQIQVWDSFMILIVFVFRAVNVLWIWVITTIKRGLCRYIAENIVSIIVLKLLTRCVQILCQNKHQFLWKTCCHLRLQTDENVINKTEHVTSILSVKLSSTSPAHFLSQHKPHLDINTRI